MTKLDSFLVKLSNNLKTKEIERWISNPHLHQLSERDKRLIRVFEKISLRLMTDSYVASLSVEKINLMESRIVKSKFTKNHHTHLAAKVAADHVLNRLKRIKSLKEKELIKSSRS